MYERFAHWTFLFIHYLKRDWKKIIFWIAGVGLFSGGFVPAFKEIAKGSGLAGMFETMQNPAMIAMVGPLPVKAAADYTIGAMYTNEMLLFCALLAMIVAMLHVVGHTRKEEELGLTEVIRALPVGRQANSLAIMVEVVVVNLLLALFTGGLMTAFQVHSVDWGGSLVFGASLAAAGIIGGAAALFLAQIMPTATGATGTSLGLVGVLYLVRAWTDYAHPAWSWMNPLGWTYLTSPFIKNNWLPIGWGLCFSLLAVFAAFMLEGARDYNSGYLPEREGRADAPKWMINVPGFTYYLNQMTAISWWTAFLLFGVAYGSIYGDMKNFLNSNQLLQAMFAQTKISIEVSFTSSIMVVLVGMCAILPIAIVNKLFTEEERGRFGPIFASKVTRTQLFGAAAGFAVIAGLISILLSAAGLGGTALMVMTHTKMTFWDFLAAGLNYAPSVLFFIGLAALCLGWLPRLAKIVYVYLGYAFMLSYFSGILNLPKWVVKTSPFEWLAKMPTESFDWKSFLIVSAVSVLLILCGWIGYKRRDLADNL